MDLCSSSPVMPQTVYVPARKNSNAAEPGTGSDGNGSDPAGGTPNQTPMQFMARAVSDMGQAVSELDRRQRAMETLAPASDSAGAQREIVTPLPSQPPQPAQPSNPQPPQSDASLQSQVSALQQEVAELSSALQLAQPGSLQGAEGMLMNQTGALQDEFPGYGSPAVQDVDAYYAARTGEPLP